MTDREKSELHTKMTGKAVFNTNLFEYGMF